MLPSGEADSATFKKMSMEVCSIRDKKLMMDQFVKNLIADSKQRKNFNEEVKLAKQRKMQRLTGGASGAPGSSNLGRAYRAHTEMD